MLNSKVLFPELMVGKSADSFTRYLGKDEILEDNFFLQSCVVHATNKRLFLEKDDGSSSSISDFSYDHISSISFERRSFSSYFIIGAPNSQYESSSNCADFILFKSR